MLIQLHIDGFALVDHCLIDFQDGFIALTGETGAGKSIIVDALGACIGARISSDVVRSGAAKAQVEAVFARAGHADEIAAILAESGIDDEETLVLSREIQPSGRSISLINGRARPLSTLSRIGEQLVDVHGQSEHLSILKPARQLDMLDHFGRLESLRAEFQQAAKDVAEARAKLLALESNRRQAEQRLDFLRFQVDEIEGAQLEAGEVQSLETELIRLANAERLALLATQTLQALDGEDLQTGCIDSLAGVLSSLAQLTNVDRSLEGTLETAQGLQFQLQDLATTVRSYRDSIEFDPIRLEAVQSRLDQIHKLCRKYGDSVDDVLRALEAARSEVDRIQNYEDNLRSAQQAVAETETVAGRIAADLSRRRLQVAEEFVVGVRARLSRLGLGPALFEVTIDHNPSDDGIPVSIDGDTRRLSYSAAGIDRVHFMASFNVGEAVRPIERVASGGETARFMLAVKATLATADEVPTLVFDEIDTGVGGRSGSVVAEMLSELGESHQVLLITHLPQIASQAGQHLKVSKRDTADRTSIQVTSLKGPERVAEIAEMLSGTPPSSAAVQAASEMLSAAPKAAVAG